MDETPQTTAPDEAQAAPGFAAVASPLDVGPRVRPPFFAMLAAAWGATAVVAFLAQGTLILMGQLTGPNKAGVWLGALAVALAHLFGLLAMRPWIPRHLGRLPFVWLVGRGVSFGSVLVLAAVLYSATRPSPLPFGLVIASGYFAALLAEVAAYASRIRSHATMPTSA